MKKNYSCKGLQGRKILRCWVCWSSSC